MNEFWEDNCILKGYMGSLAHGTYQPGKTEDKDIMGVCVSPKTHVIGLDNFECYVEQKNDLDLVIYDVRKFFRLLLKCNPNVLGLLWLRPQDYLTISPEGQKIIDNRMIFVSREKVYKAFTGYAYGQLRKMTHFQKYEGYMGKKRKELVDKYGWDVKNGSHALRILRQGLEFLSTGELNVFRHDRQQLIAIKNGEWSLLQVKEEAERLLKLAEEAFVRSSLPEKAEYEKANNLLIGIIEEYWKKEK